MRFSMIFSILFLILLIFAFFLLFFVCLPRGLSILLIFLKNQLLVSLIFTIVFNVSKFIDFCSYFYDFSLQLDLNLFWSSCSSFLNQEFRLWDETFLLFYNSVKYKLPTSTAFTVSHKLWYVVFSFSHSSKYFIIYLENYSSTMNCLGISSCFLVIDF